MKKKIMLAMAFCMLLLSGSRVDAQEYYKNNRNVKIPNQDYEILKKYYSTEVLEEMSEEQLRIAQQVDYTNTKTITKYIKTDTLYNTKTNEVIEEKQTEISDEEYQLVNDSIKPLAACGEFCWETSYKKLQMSITPQGYPSSIGSIIVKNNWKIIPSAKSNDVIASTYNNAFTTTNYYAYKIYDGVTTEYNASRNNANINKTNYGVGVSMDIPNSTSKSLSNELYIYGRFSDLNHWLNGSICSTYQHAQSYVSLEDSKKYTFSRCNGGLGNVLNYSSSTIADKYDKMQGVYYN